MRVELAFADIKIVVYAALDMMVRIYEKVFTFPWFPYPQTVSLSLANFRPLCSVAFRMGDHN